MCELCGTIDLYEDEDIYLETCGAGKVYLCMEWEATQSYYGNPDNGQCEMQINFCPECGKDLRRPTICVDEIVSRIKLKPW